LANKVACQGKESVMTVELLRETLFWCSVINIGVLFVWFMIFTLAHGWLYRIQSIWFRMPAEHFDTIHYAGMALFKIGLIFFNLVPYVALSMVT
jgi:hypothetical protein